MFPSCCFNTQEALYEACGPGISKSYFLIPALHLALQDGFKLCLACEEPLDSD
ncbi:hypothetical protein EM20IM_07050 [Candidatus Methylacidiphilum infernorum]|uniref:Uncharacterized protein n=1 Tax=Candidatus Methylacidiphilum infernorum TaxID=511746 RepID=A0ABX7PTF2_9BACT|nr:hypothetical protein [Candidatus Methylacidiphilum infernorum]QSR86255.1 hypothetical protein EM20IM_07050 [Candidatus Methylacidiphilum infernorum]